MAKKWTNLAGTLPEPPPESTEWQQKVIAAKEMRNDATMRALVVEYNALCAEEDRAKELEKARNVAYAAIEWRMREEFEKSGSDIWRGEGYSFSPGHALRASVEDKAALKKWVLETGQEDLLSVMPGTVTALASAALDVKDAASLTPAQRAALKPGDAGSGAPPPGVKVYLQPKVDRRKS